MPDLDRAQRCFVIHFTTMIMSPACLPDEQWLCDMGMDIDVYKRERERAKCIPEESDSNAVSPGLENGDDDNDDKISLASPSPPQLVHSLLLLLLLLLLLFVLAAQIRPGILCQEPFKNSRWWSELAS